MVDYFKVANNGCGLDYTEGGGLNVDSDPPSAQTELEALEARLLALELEKQSLLERKWQLVAAEQVNDQTMPPIEVPVSTGDKIALFRSFFRGRDDIFAVRWENSQGRRGYALACENEWRQGICYKPKVKCGDCRHQAFPPLDDRAIYAHLSGKTTLGLYPLLRDDLRNLLGEHSDTPLVVIKANVCRLVEPRLVRDGFTVLNRGRVVFFPSHGQQGRFHQQFEALVGPAPPVDGPAPSR